MYNEYQVWLWPPVGCDYEKFLFRRLLSLVNISLTTYLTVINVLFLLISTLFMLRYMSTYSNGQNKVIHCVRNAFSDFIYFIIIWFYAMPKRIRNQKQKFTTAINVSSYILWEFFFYRHYREFREVDFSHLSLSFIYFCFQLKSSFIA